MPPEYKMQGFNKNSVNDDFLTKTEYGTVRLPVPPRAKFVRTNLTIFNNTKEFDYDE